MPAPVLAGVTLPPHNTAPAKRSKIGGDIALAGGRLARYRPRRRWSASLTWGSLNATDYATVMGAAATLGPTTYVDYAGTSRTVYIDDPTTTPIAGTSPVRHSVQITLTAVRPD